MHFLWGSPASQKETGEGVGYLDPASSPRTAAVPPDGIVTQTSVRGNIVLCVVVWLTVSLQEALLWLVNLGARGRECLRCYGEGLVRDSDQAGLKFGPG